MNSRNTKISKIINTMFDSRMELMVMIYIMDEGMSNIELLTDEDIKAVESNGLMTKEFCQELVKTAREICKECAPMEIMEYIRLHLWFTPATYKIEFYRDDYKEWKFEEILNILNLDDDQVGDSFAVYAIVDEGTLKNEEE